MLQPHVAVQSRTRIPARVQSCVHHLDGDDVVPVAESQLLRDIDFERLVAIVVVEQFLSVHIHFRLVVRSFHVQHHAAGLVRARCLECLSVPSFAAFRLARVPASDAGASERTDGHSLALIGQGLHAPIVRQVQYAPFGVVEIRGFRIGNDAAIESPTVIKIFLASLGGCRELHGNCHPYEDMPQVLDGEGYHIFVFL